MAAIALPQKSGGFFNGLDANKLISFGIDAYSSKATSDQAKADKADADATQAAYAAAAQNTRPASLISGIDNKMLIGGGVLAVVLVGFLIKGS